MNYILLPAFNEKKNLVKVLQNIEKICIKIKKDGYQMIAVEKILNKGIGKTINDRLNRASKY